MQYFPKFCIYIVTKVLNVAENLLKAFCKRSVSHNCTQAETID